MSVFDAMMMEQKNLIVALPYRVGLFISKSDDAGGDGAQDKELQTLSNIIDGFARDVFGSELVQEIMGHTLARRDDWHVWQENWQRVPQECTEALGILGGYVEAKEIKAYRARLIEIAEAVALAFSEYNEKPDFATHISALKAFLGAKLSAQKNGKPVRSYDQFLSISPAERAALSRVAAAMDVQTSL